MKKLFFFLMLTNIGAKAQTVTDSTVRAYINSALPDNNVRAITPALLRSTLYEIINLINRKVYNDQIVVSKNGRAITIKPITGNTTAITGNTTAITGNTTAIAAKNYELFREFQAMPEVLTNFNYKQKPIYQRKILLNVTQKDEVIMPASVGIEHIHSIEGSIVWTDANNYQQMRSIANAGAVNVDTAIMEITASDFDCSPCTNKQYYLTINYTKK